MKFFSLKVAVLFSAMILSSSLANAETYRPWDHAARGSEDLVSSNGLTILGVGTAATLIALPLDQPLKKSIRGDDPLHPYDKLGNDWLGTGVPGAVLSTGILAYGLINKRQHEIDCGIAGLESLTVTAAVTFGLKFSVRRERPNSTSKTSFPSGHTSTTFASATNLHDFYHDPWVSSIAYGLAVFTGAGRITAQRHYLSDVVAGATIGIWVAHSFSQHHLREQRIEPVVELEPDQRFIGARIRF